MGKILVVDDNEQTCDILEDVLTTWGYEVQKSFQGKDAIQLAFKHKPDMILLDVMLPGINGYEVCKKLKEDSNTQDIPIIMLTVLTDVDDRIRGFNVGADSFLSKPINYHELQNQINILLKRKKENDKLEQQMSVVNSYMYLLKEIDQGIYNHSCTVKEYCEKVGHILSLTEDELNRLAIGAYLHDIGKILRKNNEHVLRGEEIITPFKMEKWLTLFIRNHHEHADGSGYPDQLYEYQLPLTIKILCTVNRFTELWEASESKEKGLAKIKIETTNGWWDYSVYQALEQVIKDEKFIEEFKIN